MAWRDSRRSRRRQLLCAASMILGVAALVAVGSLARTLRGSIDEQAKTLLARISPSLPTVLSLPKRRSF